MRLVHLVQRGVKADGFGSVFLDLLWTGQDLAGVWRERGRGRDLGGGEVKEREKKRKRQSQETSSRKGNGLPEASPPG